MKPSALLPLALGLFTFAAHAQSFYKDPALFSMRPDEKKSNTIITRFGPVGLSLDLIQPAFTIQILDVEKGSPAEAAGLKKGQIIESINKMKLQDMDPRMQLGDMITAAEAADGVMNMMVADKPGAPLHEVVVKIPALGAFSETWPLNCPKSDAIVRNYAAYLKKPDANRGLADMGMLFLMSTGDEGDLAFVRDWARKKKDVPGIPWHLGYGGLALCEYYLRTGDPEVMPMIQARADKLVEMENHGGWASRGPMAELGYGGGGGHLNAAGVLCTAYLLMAKECGADVPEDTLLRTLAHLYRFAGRGNVPYGNNKPENGFTDNGKNGKNAFVMAAAANLTPDGEKSVYARARDTASQFAFYSTGYMLHGHTGGGIGEIWRSASMGLLHEKMPSHYRDFMEKRRWHYEMSRSYDGSFGILGGERYDNPEWGVGYALTFTVPRKTLRLTGAPPTKFSKPYQLPARPWGTAEDDDFESIVPAKLPDGTIPDISKETITDSTGFAMISKRGTPLERDRLLHYLHHPNYTVRTIYVDEIAKHDPALLDSLLASEDARVRRTALEFLEGKAAGPELLTAPRLERIHAILSDDNESWFVQDAALRVVAKAPKEWIAAQLGVILPYLDHQEWWFHHSALIALTPVVTDERCYRKVIPAIGKRLRTNHVVNILNPIRWGAIPDSLRTAPPAVQELAKKEFRDAYGTYESFGHPLKEVNDKVDSGMRQVLAEALANVPGGFDVLYQVSKERNPDAALPYADLYLKADAEKFSPALRKEVAKLIETRLIPRYIGESRDYLLKELANENVPPNYYYREPRVLGLANLYRQIGVHEYDWRDFGPSPDTMKWHYFTFDPPEKIAWDSGKIRYRPVTLPKGTEDWYKPDFDPSKAGWKTGLTPFGAVQGKLQTSTAQCPYDFCRHHLPMQTLWDKEVLLLRGKFKFPQLKEGHRYHLLVGGMSHVSAGEGHRIYINGKLFLEKTRGVDKREGAQPISGHISREWWQDFQSGETDIAFMGFMGVKGGVPNRHLTIWVQEMKLPLVGDKELLDSAKVMPMTSSAWQALQDTDANDLDPEQGKFLWDGKFVSNPDITGSWKAIGIAANPADFDPAKPKEASRAPIQALHLKPDGSTDDPLFLWSGGTLMDLHKNEALQMQKKSLNGTDYLFIEAGGFQTKSGNAWKCPWVILKRL